MSDQHHLRKLADLLTAIELTRALMQQRGISYARWCELDARLYGLRRKLKEAGARGPRSGPPARNNPG